MALLPQSVSPLPFTKQLQSLPLPQLGPVPLFPPARPATPASAPLPRLPHTVPPLQLPQSELPRLRQLFPLVVLRPSQLFPLVVPRPLQLFPSAVPRPLQPSLLALAPPLFLCHPAPLNLISATLVSERPLSQQPTTDLYLLSQVSLRQAPQPHLEQPLAHPACKSIPCPQMDMSAKFIYSVSPPKPTGSPITFLGAASTVGSSMGVAAVAAFAAIFLV